MARARWPATTTPHTDMSTSQPVTTQDRSPKATRLATYLREELERSDELYVKGKFIAEDVGLSPHEIGALLCQLQESLEDVTIEQWSYTSATTWRVTSE